MLDLDTVTGGNGQVASASTRPRWLWLTVPLVALACGASTAGIVVDSVYEGESANWAAQAVGQDLANLVAFSALALFAVLAVRGSLRAYLLWLGVLAYGIYAYAIYAFAIGFGPLFLAYVGVLGMSVFGLIGGTLWLEPRRVRDRFGSGAPVTMVAWVLTVIAAGFGVLWLTEILPATIDGTLPTSLTEAGLRVNPVYVLDLSVLLPSLVVTGVLLRRGRSWGWVLAPVQLVALTLIALGIEFAMVVLGARDLAVAAQPVVMVAVIGTVQLIVLWRLLRSLERDDLAGARRR
jgi:hypothetical protein